MVVLWILFVMDLARRTIEGNMILQKKKPLNALLTTGTTWKRVGQNQVVVVGEESQRRESHGTG